MEAKKKKGKEREAKKVSGKKVTLELTGGQVEFLKALMGATGISIPTEAAKAYCEVKEILDKVKLA